MAATQASVVQAYDALPICAKVDLCNLLFGEDVRSAQIGIPLSTRAAQMRLCHDRFTEMVARLDSTGLAIWSCFLAEKLPDAQAILVEYQAKCADADGDQVELLLCLKVECDQCGFGTDITYEDDKFILWVYMDEALQEASAQFQFAPDLQIIGWGFDPIVGAVATPSPLILHFTLLIPTAP